MNRLSKTPISWWGNSRVKLLEVHVSGHQTTLTFLMPSQNVLHVYIAHESGAYGFNVVGDRRSR